MATKPISGGDPTLDIEVFECEACESKFEDLGFRRPHNSLEGEIRVSSDSELHFTRLGVLFEGEVVP